MQKEYGINNENELHKLHEQSTDYRGAENTEN